MKIPGIIIFCILSFGVLAYENLGPLNLAMEKYPEIFIPGNVNKLKIDGKESYVFAGQAEQLFSAKNAEADRELYQEASLAAKNIFYQKLSKGNKRIIVTMSQCDVLYQFRKGKVYTVILFVPVESVSVAEKKESSGEKNDTAAEDTPANEKKKDAPPEEESSSPEDRKDASPEEKKSAEERNAAKDKKDAASGREKAAEEETAAVPEDNHLDKKEKPVVGEKKDAVSENREGHEVISREEKESASVFSDSELEESQSDNQSEEEPESSMDDDINDIRKTKEELDSFLDSFFK